MGEHYLYDMKTEKWQQAASVDQNVPVVLVLKVFQGEKWQKLVWCPEHGTFEKIHHLERRDSIRSITGCRMQGMVAVLAADIWSDSMEDTEKKYYVPFCWLVNPLGRSILGEFL